MGLATSGTEPAGALTSPRCGSAAERNRLPPRRWGQVSAGAGRWTGMHPLAGRCQLQGDLPRCSRHRRPLFLTGDAGRVRPVLGVGCRGPRRPGPPVGEKGVPKAPVADHAAGALPAGGGGGGERARRPWRSVIAVPVAGVSFGGGRSPGGSQPPASRPRPCLRDPREKQVGESQLCRAGVNRRSEFQRDRQLCPRGRGAVHEQRGAVRPSSGSGP
jgi:hypothetical protein